MKPNTSTLSDTDPLNELIANPITDPIQVEIADSYAPILIDLHHLFGGEYRFQAAVECYGVVDIDLIDKNGLLYLSANPEALDGSSTRVAVSAFDEAGQSQVWTLEVEAVLIDSRSALVA